MLKAIETFQHPVTDNQTPEYIIFSHFLAGEMLYKTENNDSALLQFEKAISLYENRLEDEIKERIFWALYNTGNINAQIGEEDKALKIFKNLIDSDEGEGSLWKKMSLESYQSLSNKISYENYLNQ